MRSFRRWAQFSLATMFALTLPLSQAQAQDCVQFSGLKHCAVGSARLMVQGTELTAQTNDTSGKSGVSVDTVNAKTWEAGLSYEPSDKAQETTVKTFLAGGKVVATSTVTDSIDGRTFAASFVDATGKPTTYSAMILLEGRLVATVSGLPSGAVAARGSAFPSSPGRRPSCTILRYDLCMQMCGGSTIDCAYCKIPCRDDFVNDVWTLGNGRIPYLSLSFRSPFGFSLGGFAATADPVVGDELVLVADAPSAGAAQDADQVAVKSTAKTLSLSNESVIRR